MPQFGDVDDDDDDGMTHQQQQQQQQCSWQPGDTDSRKAATAKFLTFIHKRQQQQVHHSLPLWQQQQQRQQQVQLKQDEAMQLALRTAGILGQTYSIHVADSTAADGHSDTASAAAAAAPLNAPSAAHATTLQQQVRPRSDGCGLPAVSSGTEGHVSAAAAVSDSVDSLTALLADQQQQQRYVLSQRMQQQQQLQDSLLGNQSIQMPTGQQQQQQQQQQSCLQGEQQGYGSEPANSHQSHSNSSSVQGSAVRTPVHHTFSTSETEVVPRLDAAAVVSRDAKCLAVTQQHQQQDALSSEHCYFSTADLHSILLKIHSSRANVSRYMAAVNMWSKSVQGSNDLKTLLQNSDRLLDHLAAVVHKGTACCYLHVLRTKILVLPAVQDLLCAEQLLQLQQKLTAAEKRYAKYTAGKGIQTAAVQGQKMQQQQQQGCKRQLQNSGEQRHQQQQNQYKKRKASQHPHHQTHHYRQQIPAEPEQQTAIAAAAAAAAPRLTTPTTAASALPRNNSLPELHHTLMTSVLHAETAAEASAPFYKPRYSSVEAAHRAYNRDPTSCTFLGVKTLSSSSWQASVRLGATGAQWYAFIKSYQHPIAAARARDAALLALKGPAGQRLRLNFPPESYSNSDIAVAARMMLQRLPVLKQRHPGVAAQLAAAAAVADGAAAVARGTAGDTIRTPAADPIAGEAISADFAPVAECNRQPEAAACHDAVPVYTPAVRAAADVGVQPDDVTAVRARLLPAVAAPITSKNHVTGRPQRSQPEAHGVNSSHPTSSLTRPVIAAVTGAYLTPVVVGRVLVFSDDEDDTDTDSD